MKRSMYLIIVTVMVAFSIVIWAQKDFSDVEIKTVHAAGNVYMLEGRGGNIGVSVGEDGVLIVDDQFEELPETWKSWGTGFISTDRWIETVYKSLEE